MNCISCLGVVVRLNSFKGFNLAHNVLHPQPPGFSNEAVASDPLGILLQKLSVLHALGHARSDCLERHCSSLHHPCRKRNLYSKKKNLSALKSGSLSRSYFARKVFELRLLLSPLFHSLSIKQNENATQ